ncbi:UDP-glucose/GDP-mannose dehydrogenase family protein [Qipengyuania xiapuensis]|uniref:UDP-glucose 6-dehydrogenase n=1 Tax=Qipengyuania xiapuensis TaxID=2867236 RepID=A0ABX8ZVQ3_9SPHN|nr:UDP-glucose/GDP-mannose dehydrogenase family protein [Qipengyuania xiapuensis]QZD93077.1 UDP-glucose/GDP-mannose dehydrogenase family protein [Qipengyuania xiapuensis]
MRIGVVGSGYVGLVSGACFADFGHDVTCVDIDEEKTAALNRGEVPIFEPGLDMLIERNVAAGRLAFTTDLAGTVRASDVVFIAVGTPSRRGDGHADLSYVESAAREIGAAIEGFTVVVTKSTVPVGTGERVEEIIREANPDADFAVVSNPEFLREGAAISDFKRPDRIVIGSDDPRALEVMREVYRPLFLNKSPVVEMNRSSAELAKYASNAFLATKIAFINEIADLCEKTGADVQNVAHAIGLDKRIGPKFLHAGPGYGGSCFPKDTLALLKTAQDYEVPQLIVESVVSSNDKRKRAMGRRIVHAIGDNARGKKVAILGLTFKPETDDTRDSPAIAIIQALQDAGANVSAYDPQGVEQASKVLSHVDYASSPYEAAEDAEAVVIVTEWDEFRALDLSRIRDCMRDLVLVDLRNIYRRQEVERLGMKYVAVGR